MKFEKAYFDNALGISQNGKTPSFSPIRAELLKSTDFSIISVGPKGGVSYNPSGVIDYLRSQRIVFENGIPRRFNGRIYEKITNQQVKDYIYDACEDSGISYTPTDTEIKNTISAATSMLRAERVLRGFPEPEMEEKYLSELGLAVFENGILNIETQELLPFTPYLYLTSYIHARFDPSITDSDARRILTGIIPNQETLDFFYEMCGYIIFEQQMYPPALFNIYGPGKCGKSTLAETIGTIMGRESTAKIGIGQLTAQFTTAELEGKRLNICGETGGKSSNETKVDGELIKRLADGDEILVERKHRDPHYILNTAKFIFVTNMIPDFGDQSSGLYRRLYVIPCRVEQTEEKLKEKLVQDDCKSWLINKAWMAYQLFLRNKKEFRVSPQMKLELNQYMSQDSVLDFLNSTFGTLNRYELAVKIAESEEYSLSVNLYEAYVNYTRLALSQPLSRKKFVERIRNEYNLRTKVVAVKIGEGTTTKTKYVL